MPRFPLVIAGLALLAAAGAPNVHADIVCGDSSYVCVDFHKTYSRNYRKGQPYDYLTVAPNGVGETSRERASRFASTSRTAREPRFPGCRPRAPTNWLTSRPCSG